MAVGIVIVIVIVIVVVLLSGWRGTKIAQSGYVLVGGGGVRIAYRGYYSDAV